MQRPAVVVLALEHHPEPRCRPGIATLVGAVISGGRVGQVTSALEDLAEVERG